MEAFLTLLILSPPVLVVLHTSIAYIRKPRRPSLPPPCEWPKVRITLLTLRDARGFVWVHGEENLSADESLDFLRESDPSLQVVEQQDFYATRPPHTVPTLPVASPQEQREAWDVLRGAIQHLPDGPPDTTEGDEPTRLADSYQPEIFSISGIPHTTDHTGKVVPVHFIPAFTLCEPSTVPVPQTAAHDAQAAQGRSYIQPHIAKGQ